MARKYQSVTSYALKRKLSISFALMSVLPLLVATYLASRYILPNIGFKLDIVASLLISIFIAVGGFLLIKEVFDRIVSISTEAKMMAAGDITRKLNITQEDEIGDLGYALNQLTQRIRSNMDELKSYGEKTTEINFEIQRRVIILSSLLQISSLISQSVKLEDILKVTVEKTRFIANSDMAYLFSRDEGQETFYAKAVDGLNSDYFLNIKLGAQDSLFNKTINANKPLILDKKNILTGDLTMAFYEKFRLRNTLALPIYLRGRVIAILGIGNNKESFLFDKDDIDLLDIFTKQIAIAIENDVLMRKVESLEIKDALTGLYNESFIRNHLQEEIRRAIACQRPCAFILLAIDGFKNFEQNFGLLQAENALKRIGDLIKESVTEIDRVGRFGDDEFAIVLPEKNKRRAQGIAEDIRKKVDFIYSAEEEANKKITINAGVSENPVDGIEAEKLIARARELVNIAKREDRNRIVS